MESEPQIDTSNQSTHDEHMSKWKQKFSVLTPLSKYLALVLFVALAFAGFWLVVKYVNIDQVAIESTDKVKTKTAPLYTIGFKWDEHGAPLALTIRHLNSGKEFKNVASLKDYIKTMAKGSSLIYEGGDIVVETLPVGKEQISLAELKNFCEQNEINFEARWGW